MQQDILINWSPQETRVAVVENGAVQELHVERTLERGLVGNVYLGKVARVLPGMQSAFIDIGLERSAFLHVADLWQRPLEGESLPAHRNGGAQRPIEKQVFEGQTLMVQVIKDPIGTKGARLSTQISVAGRMLVFLPQDEHIGVSQKIAAGLRDALRERVQQLARAAAPEGKTGGYILRTNAEDASDAELAEDIAYLRKTWTRIREAATRLPPASLLHEDLRLLQRVLRDLVGEGTQSIRIDSREQFDALMAFGKEFMPAAAARLSHYRGERPIFDLFNVDDEIAKALGRRVDLKSGGYLIVDQTEALTTVDVNTGGFIGTRNFDETVFKTNLEAAQAIARQLRLRNLGGIIVVDFIDMSLPEHQQAVLAEFRKQLARDRVKTQVGGFSHLGLVEMTRKRTRESLAQLLCEPCEQCQGSGRVRTARTVAYDVLREILREARQFNPREFRVVAAPAVIDMLIDEESQHLAGLSDFIGKPISLQAESAVGPDQYDIVLL
ncbi:MAG: ribonuclease G [Burkholderiales bacterium]|nr:ribonuclease G [Burkholderiales bacterium]MBS0402257.1 ribonuclease G [Pseudomonadota bacterium]MBS0414586.1 ribonuclease G [Pseudomonadota bacterium]